MKDHIKHPGDCSNVAKYFMNVVSERTNKRNKLSSSYQIKVISLSLSLSLTHTHTHMSFQVTILHKGILEVCKYLERSCLHEIKLFNSYCFVSKYYL